MANIPFLMTFGSDLPYYNHNIFPNHLFRRQHPRHHDSLDLHTLGLMARLGAHGHHAGGGKNGEMSLLSHSHDDKNGFEVNLDVGLFLPEELTVKVVNNSIIVQGQHEEREDDHGHISRHFVRRYSLPNGYNADKVVSTLSPDGVLKITAPKPVVEPGEERIVPIQQTGPSDLFLKNGEKPNVKQSNDEKK